MKVLLLGDIGWPHLYHLGDEAMTEAAIEQLTARGLADITLVSAVPSVATERYGLPAVERIGFSLKWSRRGLQGTLDKVTWTLESDYRGHDGVNAMIDAVTASDAVIIAGGGNMNSQFVHHLFERTALARIAAHLGKPLFVTSQTVGPLRVIDEPLVKEILSTAVCFGARDAATRDLLLSLGGESERIVHIMDDAFLLEASDDDRQKIENLGLADRPIIASIQPPSSDVEVREDEFYVRMAQTLDAFAARYDTDVALLPHAGSFDAEVVKDDVATHAAIARLSGSGRIIALPMLTARQAIALTDAARFSLSTRYHPVIFGPARAVPAFGLVPNLFTLVRMRGALDNVGLASYALPIDVWLDGPFTDIVDDGLRSGLLEHASAVAEQRRNEQALWWDALVAALRTGGWNRPNDLSPVPAHPVSPRYRDWLEQSTRRAVRLGGVRAELMWSALELRDARDASRTAADERTRQHGELAERFTVVASERDALQTQLLDLRAALEAATSAAAEERIRAERRLDEAEANLVTALDRIGVLRRENARILQRRSVRWADRLGRLLRRS